MKRYRTQSTLARCRVAAGYTQKELARQLGLDQQHISRWERGVHVPCWRNLKRLSRVLGVKAEELID